MPARTLVILASLSISCGGAALAKRAAAPQTLGASAGPMVAATGGTATQPATVATAGTNDSLSIPEKLVIEAWVSVDVDDVRAAATAIAADVARAGGRVVNERIDGSARVWNAHLEIRLPPDKIDGFWDFLAGLGEIRSKQVKATDVSKTLFDQKIRLDNLTLTLGRLRQLLENRAMKMGDVLEIEKEMTRVRAEIERIKGERRYLQDRVAYSTITLTLEHREGVVLRPEAKFYPGGRFVLMTLLGDLDGRERTRLGFGAVLQFPVGKSPVRTAIELDILADADGTGNGVIATTGVGVYSDFFGAGRRAFLNPYISFRAGYAYLDDSRFAIGGGAGVELFKHERVMIDLNLRAIALIGSETDTALVGGVGGVIAF